ncbi:hypothetical protein K0U07_01785 [bacterium]|nr:hypothetical protein [bacterium]
MGYEISAKDLTEITKTGTVTFAEFLSEEEVAILKHSGNTRDSFQNCPLTKKILTKRDLGKLLFEILEKKPIRLVFSKNISPPATFPLEDLSIDEVFIGMFLSYEDGSVTFFTKEATPELTDAGMMVVYGNARARFLPKEADKESSFLLKKGYASGDKLETKDYPLIFK